MTEDEKIAVLRGMVDDEDSDSVLSVYLKIAGERILRKAYPFDATIKKVPDKYDMLQCEIAAYLLNKRGAEGQTKHQENGISREYEDADIPSSMLKGIIPQCSVIQSSGE